MTQDSADPVIKILDDYLQDPAITRIDDSDPEGYPGCGTSGSSARVCYSITHTGPQVIPGGSALKFQISGTTNPESVVTASAFTAQTQMRDIA